MNCRPSPCPPLRIDDWPTAGSEVWGLLGETWWSLKAQIPPSQFVGACGNDQDFPFYNSAEKKAGTRENAIRKGFGLTGTGHPLLQNDSSSRPPHRAKLPGSMEALLNTASRAVSFRICGKVGAAGFPEWLIRHARKLGLEMRFGNRSASFIDLRLAGPAELIDAMEVACLLGPIDVWVDRIEQDRLPEEAGDMLPAVRPSDRLADMP